MTFRIRTFYWRWEVIKLNWFPHILYESELVLVRICADFLENQANIVLRIVLFPTNWIASNHNPVFLRSKLMNSSRNKNKRRDSRGEALRLLVVLTVVCSLDSQSQPSLSSSPNGCECFRPIKEGFEWFVKRSIYHRVPPTACKFSPVVPTSFSPISIRFHKSLSEGSDALSEFHMNTIFHNALWLPYKSEVLKGAWKSCFIYCNSLIFNWKLWPNHNPPETLAIECLFVSSCYFTVSVYQLAMSEQWDMRGTVRRQQLRLHLQKRLQRKRLRIW